MGCRRWLQLRAIVLTSAIAAAPASSTVASQPAPPTRPAATEPGPLERIAVRPSLDVAAPRRTAYVAPDWPAGAGGRVRYRVHLVIDARGAVAESRIVSLSGPSGHPSEEAAEKAAVLAAVQQWKFEPPARAPMLLRTYVGRGEADGIVVPSPTEPRPIRIGGGIRPPTKIHHVSPAYPAEAREAGVSGVVILEATIDPEGAVSDMQIVRSVAGLDEAAMAAVRQWRYAPTVVNGERVPVIMTVTVNFQPNQ